MKLVDKNYYLNCAARDAYRSSLQAYASHHQREIFDVANLDLQMTAEAFGLTAPPRVNLAIKVTGRNARTNKYKLKDQLGDKKAGKSHYKDSSERKRQNTGSTQKQY